MSIYTDIRSNMALFEEVRAGRIANNDDPRDPDVDIQGFGIMRLSQLKADVQDKLENLVARGTHGDYSTANYAINEQGTLGHFLKAIADVEAELKEE